MKKYIFFILIIFALSSCGDKITPAADYIPYEQIPDNYSLDDAKADDCVVYENGNITSGQIIWDSFIAQTRPCMVRLAFYYTLGEPERYDPAHYEEIKYDYPVLYIQDLKFVGSSYNLSWSEGEQEYSFDYKYMKKFTGEPSSSTAIFSDYIYYVLLNDDTVDTWAQIERSMFSSHSVDFIDYKRVYSYLNYN